MSWIASMRSSLPHLAMVSLGAALLLTAGACDNRTNNTARCTPGCSSVQLCCGNSAGNRCVDHFSDPANCGGCGNVCASGQLCVNRMCMNASGLPDAGAADARTIGTDAPITGSCTPSCGSTQQCCGSTCVARDGSGGTSDPSFSNCGSCGRACDADVANHCGRFGTMTTCMCGSGPACDGAAGETCSLGTSGDYECLRSDIPSNCGTPPVACNTGESCEAGHCVCGSLGRACATGESCVSSGGTSTCRDLSTDENNCGMVGRMCAAGEDCVGGTCLCPGAGGTMTACMAAGGGGLPIGGGPASCGASGGLSLPCGGGGGLPIGGSCGEVCCAGVGCVPVDNSNCGGCGVMCAADEECGTSLGGGGDGGLPFP
ncbi:MAG: hypothetical protein K1X94_22285 [Sandaracinaceae bacterium]|nr:hypothetical protein [Sandaracinaceae bacterium]